MTEAQHYDCPLCRLVFERELLTRLVYEDDLIIVVDCLVCQVPMAVLKQHRPSYTPEEKLHVERFFKQLVKDHPVPIDANTNIEKIYGGEELLKTPEATEWVIDWEQRQIPDHAHCHLRPLHFPNTDKWTFLNPTDCEKQ